MFKIKDKALYYQKNYLKTPMKIIVCLGNPGKNYKKNRHNAGFMAGYWISEKYSISAKKKFHSLCGISRIQGTEVAFLFPKTFMNKSGTAVNAALQFYNESPEDIIVIHDEIELPFGEIKIKAGGGHKGHNGIRSIVQETGSPDFHRIRIGVGRPQNSNIPVADFLLSNFSKEELKKIEELMPDIEKELLSLLSKNQ